MWKIFLQAMSVKHSLLAFGALHFFPSVFRQLKSCFYAELPITSRQSPTFKVCFPAIVLTTPWKACYVLPYNLPCRKLEGISRMFSTVGSWCHIGIWICGCNFFVNTLVPEDISILRLSCEGGSQAHSISCRRLVPKNTCPRYWLWSWWFYFIKCRLDFLKTNFCTWFWIQMDLPMKEIVTHGHPRNSKEAIQSTYPNQRNYLTIHRMILSLFHSSWAASHWSRGLRMFEGCSECIWPNFFPHHRAQSTADPNMCQCESWKFTRHTVWMSEETGRSPANAWNRTSSKPQG